ncbi:putative lipoprotein YiaD precursor [Roseovarius sp. THAF8]|uniref:OmpA family protein n=1 Tax=Roseovarius sp. THAF8 TaxID=2587846 RepID=UPI001267EFE4|nr:OmpA family protein [Roseovarius sp. THAF8]QFT97736.1 putative lipoprotein YiaD precursor [Roseovarius sp. THAF8]
MSISQKTVTLIAGLSMLGATACTSPAYLDDTAVDRNQKAKQGALLGGLLGAGAGALVADKKVKGALIGGAVGAAGGAVAGTMLDRQEAELRNNIGNDNVDIQNTGDRLIVTLPQDILFDVDSAAVRPGLRSDLSAVAQNLQSYPDSRVQIVGHTDNSGGAEHNQALSERRANAVADVLMNGGVAFSRIDAFGRGEDAPVASNLTEDGKAQNRRVEIVILPNAA